MIDYDDNVAVQTHIRSRLVAAFQHLYPDLAADAVIVEFRDDETIVVHPGDFPSQRAVIYSDDDGFLRFTPFDEDDSPLDDDHDFMSMRVRIFPEDCGHARYRDPAADAVQVEVWDYAGQCFIQSYRCTGERRVRVDHYGPLTDLAVFEVTRLHGALFRVADGNKPLANWLIDYT